LVCITGFKEPTPKQQYLSSFLVVFPKKQDERADLGNLLAFAGMRGA
jgi:hypothetical protein